MRIALVGSLALSLSLGLGACSPPGGEMGNDPDGAIEGDIRQQPGLYRDQITLGGMEGDQAGGQYADDVKCLSEEDVRDGHRAMLLEIQGGDACRFEKYELDGSSLNAVMACRANSSQPETTATITGTVTSTGSDLRMTVAGFGDGSEGVDMRVKSERIGECEEGDE